MQQLYIYSRSTNGTTWTAQLSANANDIVDIHYGNGLWVGVGLSGRVATSTNGTMWMIQTSAGTNRAVHYANNLWVAAGDGYLFTSTNGTTWTEQFNNVDIYDIIYTDNGWLGVGAGDFVAATDTGTTWVAAMVDGSIGRQNAIHYDENARSSLWVAVGDTTSTIIAGDTAGWVGHTSDVNSRLIDLYYANGLWVAVGAGGAITTAP